MFTGTTIRPQSRSKSTKRRNSDSMKSQIYRPNLLNLSSLGSRRTQSNSLGLDPSVAIQNENRSTNTSPQRMTIATDRNLIRSAEAFLNRIKTLNEKRREEITRNIIMNPALRSETVDILRGFINIVRSNISKLIENPNYLLSRDVHSHIFILQNFVQEINSHISHITIEIGLRTPIPYLTKDIYAEKISKLTHLGGKKNVTRRKRK